MSTTVPFLQALGLDATADERAIRRAYAARLKRIDQEAEPAAFQALREAYERALHWLAWHQAQQTRQASAQTSAGAAPATVPSAAPQPGETVAPAPAGPAAAPVTRPETERASPAREALPQPEQAAGDAVFAHFIERACRVFSDEEGAQSALHEALQDDRLLNLEARTLFEWRIACLLVQGWRPGHEYLFRPACVSFDWESDRRRLALFGQVGATIDAAIQERLIFFRQPRPEFDAQRTVIQRLRSEQEPTSGELRAAGQRLPLLTQRYPHWLPIIAPAANVGRWRELLQRAAPQPAAARDIPIPESLRPAAPPSSSMRWIWIIVAGLLVVARWVASPGTGEAPRTVYNPPQIVLHSGQPALGDSPAISDWATRGLAAPPAEGAAVNLIEGGTMRIPSAEVDHSPRRQPSTQPRPSLHRPAQISHDERAQDRLTTVQQRQREVEQALRQAESELQLPQSAQRRHDSSPGLRPGDLWPASAPSSLDEQWKKPSTDLATPASAGPG